MSKSVLVGMSGGVDSTLTAYLLQQEGYRVVGAYMKLFDKPGYHEKNVEKVKKVADFLGIETHVLDLSDDFREKVYDPFVQTYKEGETPNPCGLCNRHIKFGALADFADRVGCEKIATGHYVQTDGEFLYEAEDDTKDQTYFLFNIRPEVLKRAIFPLGGRIKDEVKAFVNTLEPLKELAYQKESSEICFVETDYKEILRRHTDVDVPGQVVDRHGNVIGTHSGYMHYTVGQRRGYTLATPPDGRRYVTGIFPEENKISVGPLEELEETRIVIEQLNLFMPKKDFRTTVKIRYRAPKVACSVKILDEDRAEILLDEPVLAVAAGQAAVFYDGNKMLGGGWII